MAASSNKTFTYLALGVVAVAVLFLGYRLWLKPADSGPSSLIGLEPAGFDPMLAASGDDQFLNLLLSLQSIDLSDATRVMPLISSFVDFSTELQPQAPGRANPFAPVGSERSVIPAASAPSATTTPID